MRGKAPGETMTDHILIERPDDAPGVQVIRLNRAEKKNAITRAVGVYEHAEPESLVLDVLAGDRLLLCSDGLCRMAPDAEIERSLSGLKEPPEMCHNLVRLAVDSGGKDNVTCVVLDLVDSPLVVGDGQLLGAVRDVANLVDPGFVRRARA